MSTIKDLRNKNSKSDAELQNLAEQLGITIQQDKAVSEGGGNIDRAQLLLHLDTYEAKRRSRLAQALSYVSLVLSIVSALVSIYADTHK